MMVSAIDGQAANTNVQTMRIEVELNRTSKVSSNKPGDRSYDSQQKMHQRFNQLQQAQDKTKKAELKDKAIALT